MRFAIPAWLRVQLTCRVVVALAGIASVAGCAGANGGLPRTTRDTVVAATLNMRLMVSDSPRLGRQQSGRRRPLFVSPKTAGINLTLTGPSSASTSVDIAPGSPACGGNLASPRLCSVAVGGLAVGTYSATISTWDGFPTSGTHALGSATLSGINIGVGRVTTTSIFVGGIVSSFGTSGFISVPADGVPHQVGFALNPTDYDNEAISTTAQAPYANPITLTLAESGGAGHEVLYKNGTAAGMSATLTQASDSVYVQYDGLGAPGYTGLISVAASGVASQRVNVSPMYVTPGAYASGDTLSFTAAGESSATTITEQAAPSSVRYTTLLSGCTNVVTSAITGSGASAVATLTSGTNGSASGCSVTIEDSYTTPSTITLAAANTAPSGTLTIPNLTEYSLGISAGAKPFMLAAGADGNVWFTENAGGIGKITPTGQITEYRTGITAGAQPQAITLGPDGNMWFTETIGNAIGRITPGGVVTEFPVVTAGASPYGIASGPDNNLWFTESTASQIGRITPSGVVTEFTGLSSKAAPNAIISGPGGALWFTESGNNRIGKITTSGNVTEYATPTANSVNQQLAVGADGNLWFAEQNASAIGVLSSGGTAIAQYSSGMTSAAAPLGIVLGPDRNLWFTESASSRIGAISTTGVISEYTLQAGSMPTGLAVGSDGRLWFTELAGNKIGVITP